MIQWLVQIDQIQWNFTKSWTIKQTLVINEFRIDMVLNKAVQKVYNPAQKENKT